MWCVRTTFLCMYRCCNMSNTKLWTIIVVWRVKASQRHHVTLNEWVSRGPTYNWWLVFRDRYHHRGFLSCFWEQKVTIQWRVHNDGSVLSCMAQLAQRICLKRCFAIHISPCESSINSKMELLNRTPFKSLNMYAISQLFQCLKWLSSIQKVKTFTILKTNFYHVRFGHVEFRKT